MKKSALPEKLISLTVCLLMMCAAAICVNKSLFGYSLKPVPAARTAAAVDTVTSGPDGTTVIHTRPLCKTIGYAGPVPLDISIKDGRILKIAAQQNAETPSFLKRAEALFTNWEGKTVAEAAAMKPDAVTGATYSSTAIIDNVNAGLEYYMQTATADAPNSSSVPLKMWIALAVTLCACILPLFVKNKYYNNIQLIANIVVLGFWCGQFLDYRLMLKYLSDGIALPVGIVALLMLIAAFIYPLFGKPQHYCNHICPLGSAQILIASICRYKIKLTQKTVRALNWFRKILWAVLMLSLWLDIFTDWMDLELFQAFMVFSAPWGIIVAAALFILLSAVVARPYCRFVCPTGSLFKRSENID